MNKNKFKDVTKQNHDQLWMFTLTSIILLVLIIFLGLWNTNWDFNVILPGYGVWTKTVIADIDIWQHLRIIDGVKVTADTIGSSFDIGVLFKGLLVQLLSLILYFNERTRGLLKKAMDLSYIVTLKVIGKFKSLQADIPFRKLIGDLDLNEKIDTWKLLGGLKLEKHLNKESDKLTYERIAYENDNTLKRSKRLIRFMEKEKELREQITDIWIEEHIRHISFTYPKITVRMILTGNTNVKIARMSIEDVNLIKAGETRLRLLSNILSLGFLVIIGSITSLSFRYNIWKAILDMLIYTFPIAFAFVFAKMSCNKIHESKENEVADRLGYIAKYTGTAIIKETKTEIIDELSEKDEINKLKKALEIKSLEDKIKDIKKEA